MTRMERLRLEMLLRVRDFGQAHRDLFPESSVAGKAFARIADATAAIEHAAAAKLLAAKDGKQARIVARATVKAGLRAIARTARAMSPKTHQANSRLAFPQNLSDRSIASTVRSYITEVEPRVDAFVEHGLAPGFLNDLRQGADALDRAISERGSGRNGVAEAGRDIRIGLASGSEALVTLNGVVLNVLANDPGLIAAWKRTCEVVGDKPKRAAVKAAAAAAGAGDSAKKAS